MSLIPLTIFIGGYVLVCFLLWQESPEEDSINGGHMHGARQRAKRRLSFSFLRRPRHGRTRHGI